MEDRSLEDQLTKYLTDVHSIEVQALEQMKAAPDLAGDPQLAEAFRAHLEETREHQRLVEEQLDERGTDSTTLKDIAGRVGGWAMLAFAKLNPDTPGKLVAHAFSYEHMELAAYELLRRVAERLGDQGVVEMARTVGEQERAMGQRLADSFDRAVEASLRDKDDDGTHEELVNYLTDAHAIESQAIQLLQAGPRLAGVDSLAEAFSEHLEETRAQQALVEERLNANDADPSTLQSAAMRLGGANLGGFFAAQPDTTLKLAGFAYAFEHLEIASYELLKRVAQRAGDQKTVAAAERIANEERTAAERIAGTWDDAVDVTLSKLTTA